MRPCRNYGYHKILTYMEYRAVSFVFPTIDPHPLSPKRICPRGTPLPALKAGGIQLNTCRAVKGWGANISEDARHGLLQYNPSTIATFQDTLKSSLKHFVRKNGKFISKPRSLFISYCSSLVFSFLSDNTRPHFYTVKKGSRVSLLQPGCH